MPADRLHDFLPMLQEGGIILRQPVGKRQRDTDYDEERTPEVQTHATHKALLFQRVM
jgi:hypothetical protein